MDDAGHAMRMNPQAPTRPDIPPPGQWEKKERELWRISLLFLALLATGLAANSWESIRALPTGPLQLEGLPVGVLLLALLFAGYVWHKKHEIEQMRGLVRALQEREQAPPSEMQLERLMEIVTKSQRGYRELIDSFDDLVFALSLDGELRAANKRVIEIFDQPFSEVVGRKLDELVDEPTRAQAEKGLPRFLERRHWSGTVRVRIKRTGAVRYFECILHPILKPDAPAAPGEVGGGRLAGIGGIARDVTQLRESETRFSDLFETLQEGVYFTTPEGKLLDANPALVRMLGYASKEELLGVSVEELYWDPAERQSHLSKLDRATTSEGAGPAQEITLRRKDGQPVVCLDTSTSIRDSLGRVVRYQGTLLDVTHRREMEKRLREEQEFARRMVECFPDSIVVLDTEGRYTYASPRITEQLGYLPEELVGRSLGERSDPDDRRELLRVFDDVVHGRSSFATLEYRTRHKDGSWRRFRATAGPLTGQEGRISGVIASARDITQLHQLEQQLLQSEKLAAMGQMIAGVAHELNNPLTAILGVADLIRLRSSDPQLSRHADLAHQQARRAAEIVQNLLAFARPPALKKAPVSLNDLVRRTLQLHEYALRVNNIAVDFVPAPELPPVVADASQMVQVFLNLVINAEQALREGQGAGYDASASGGRQPGATGSRPETSGVGRGTLRVRLERRPDPQEERDSSPNGRAMEKRSPQRAQRKEAERIQANAQVLVSFADDGPGIPPDILPKIFDPFFTTKRPGRGTGLGLSICLAIVKEHGGTIDAQSTPGQGATFTVSLPLASQEEVGGRRGGRGNNVSKCEAAPTDAEGAREAETTQVSASLPFGSAQGKRKRRVLVVEDEPSIRELVQDGLGAKGLEVECVGSGNEAVQRVRDDRRCYDVVLCDLKMPGMSGEQVFEQLKTRPDGSPQPFVFMTGDPEASGLEFLQDVEGETSQVSANVGVATKEAATSRVNANQVGAKARSISKPFKISDLVNALEESIEEAKQLK